jgi:hypothetical protein
MAIAAALAVSLLDLRMRLGLLGRGAGGIARVSGAIVRAWRGRVDRLRLLGLHTRSLATAVIITMDKDVCYPSTFAVLWERFILVARLGELRDDIPRVE